jgi:hypothetical protein
MVSAFALSVVGAGLIVYDLIGPHQGWLVLGMILMFVGTVVLRKR